ncbi:MAG: PA14 domain-containing protein, partial [Lentisphaeraceae bacterium]|nr:PA14 domain-containing protein [Lentisphaeraceae bacterium]
MIKNIFFATLLSIIGTTFIHADEIANWNLNDLTTATSASDSVNGLSATKVGTVVFETAGALSTTGTSASFDGSSSLEVPYTTILNPGTTFSIDAWVKPTNGTGTTRSIVSSRSVEKNGFIVRIESNNKFRFYLGDGEWRYVEGPSAVLNEWTHVLATFESQSVTDGVHSGVAKIFVNGKLTQFKTLTYKPNTSTVRPLRIGAGGDKDQGVASVYNFTGDLDEVRIANHVVQPEDLISYFDISNGLTREIYYDIPSHGVHLITGSSKYPWHPDVIDYIKDFDTGISTGDNYGARIRGYITVPEVGNYTFHLASDDRGDLRISLDGTEENLQSIATVTGWTGHKVWDKYETQTSVAFALTAGQKIYTEAFFKEGSGGDHLAVAWSKNGGAIELITNEHLTPFTYDLAEQQQLLTTAIATAQAAYDDSASNIGVAAGQFSQSARANFNLTITASQAVLSNETNAFKLARELFVFQGKIQLFINGVVPVKLTGEIFGDELYWGGNWYKENAFDGDTSTSYHYLNRDHGYVGIDLGEGNETALTQIRFVPRKDFGSRMTNNVFQGSLDGINWTDIYTITETPAFEWTTAEITDQTAYRYYRYYDVPGGSGWGNIAELEFYGFISQDLRMLRHEIISVKADTEDQLLASTSLTAEHGGLLSEFITYKVLELPLNGIVKLNGTVLAVDSTFTQEDLNNELLTFSTNDSRLNDTFKVEVRSSVGGLLPEVFVDIMIDSDFDGLSDQQEISLGTDYDNADTNGNGIDDLWESENGLDPIADTLAPLVSEIQGENGLSAAYVYGRFSKIADFSTKAPAKVTKVANINFTASYWQEFANSGVVHDVGAKFTGYLYVPIEGNYKFTITSDDGSRLVINGSELISNDGLHSFEQKSGTVNLSAGFHPIRCEYFEAGGNHGCILQWEGPARARQVIPASYFFLSIPEHQALEESIDTDQDGSTDILEAIEGTDPLNPDSDGDRLLDGEEYHATYGYKTNPMNVDTDGDTVTDYDEIFIFHSNPLIPDFDGTVLDQISIIPKNTSTRLGEWIEDGDEIAAQNRRGALEYEVLIPVPGLFRLDLEAAQNISGSNRTNFDIHLYVDGEFVARQEQQITSGETKTYSYLTTHLRAGQHKIRIFWENVYMNSSLRVKSITLTKPGGPDENENGHPDWIDNYTDSLYSINDFSALSKVSPAQLEGKGRYLSKFITSFNDPIQQGTYNRWFTDLTLSKEGPTEFGIEFEHGLKSTTGTVTWEETNILDEGEYTFREGASMLLNAVINGDLDSSSIITVTKDGNNEFFNAAPEEPVEYKFASAGTYTVTAEYTGSQTRTKAITVNVIGAVDTDAP